MDRCIAGGIGLFWSTVCTLQQYNGAVTAVAAVLIAIFTIVLALVTNKQARLTKEAINLTRAEIVSNYRPRLRIRNVVVTPANLSMVPRMGIFQPNHPVRGQLYVVNVGGGAATITESQCMVFWTTSGLPMRRPYEGEDGNNQIPRMKLEAGQSTIGLFLSDDLLGNGASTIGNNIPNGLTLFVMGWVEYADEKGIKRRTSFCREFQKRGGFAQGRFYAVEDQDYEHEE